MPLQETTMSETSHRATVLLVQTGHDAKHLRPGDDQREYNARRASNQNNHASTCPCQADDERRNTHKPVLMVHTGHDASISGLTTTKGHTARTAHQQNQHTTYHCYRSLQLFELLKDLGKPIQLLRRELEIVSLERIQLGIQPSSSPLLSQHHELHHELWNPVEGEHQEDLHHDAC